MKSLTGLLFAALNVRLGFTLCSVTKACDLSFHWCDTAQENGFYEVKMVSSQQTLGAACLDGTPPGFYFRPGFVDSETGNDGTNQFFIYFEGGGWCAGLDEPVAPSMDTCPERSLTTLGSTLFDTPYMFSNDGYFSTEKSVNSVMYNWNSVYMRYCDGASYSGNVENAVNVDGTNLYFRGYRNVQALLEELLNNFGLDEATQVVIGGCSAGGLATYLHVPYMYDVLKANNENLERFAALPDSGFFLQYETETEKYVSGMLWVFENQNCSSGVNQKCIEAYSKTGNTWQCMFAQGSAPFINVPIFALQSRFDSWQLQYILGNTTNDTLVNQYGDTLTDTFNKTYLFTNSSLHGGLLDSCYHHCGEWNNIIVDNLDTTQMFYDMFYGKTQDIFWFQQHSYPCKQCCSP